MKILRAADHKRMPWKNGRGETVEIAVFPQGATVDTFDWRISMATVAENGPFSIFPEIDRTLSILDGNGMELAIDGQPPVHLAQLSRPCSFPADVATTARLTDGPITDLNVMTRRGRFSHSVGMFQGKLELELESADALTLVLCHHGQLDIVVDGTSETLDPLDGILLDAGQTATFSGQASGFVIRLNKLP